MSRFRRTGGYLAKPETIGLPTIHPKFGGKLRPDRRYSPGYGNLRPMEQMTARERRIKLLKEAAGIPTTEDQRFWADGRSFLSFHCLGGIAMDHPDVKWLLQRGLITIKRIPFGKVWAFDLPSNRRADLRRTKGFITDKGREALAKGLR